MQDWGKKSMKATLPFIISHNGPDSTNQVAGFERQSVFSVSDVQTVTIDNAEQCLCGKTPGSGIFDHPQSARPDG